MIEEPEDYRRRRRRQRLLFDAVAERYDVTRHGYASELVDVLFARAQLEVDDRVLEVGCGTGQLTRELARRDVRVTAIDIGSAMTELAAVRVAAANIEFRTCAYEDFGGPDRSYAAVVSATAFHWIDPDVGWKKSAAILRPGGWIAILGTAERYDDPFGAAYREQWVRYSASNPVATTRQPTLEDTIAATGLYEPAVTDVHHERRTMTGAAVIELEQTRATTLSYNDSTRAAFVADLRRLLEGTSVVSLTQETTLTMARVITP